MKTFPVLVLMICTFTANLWAQKESDQPASTFSIAINQDNAFGFYPSVNGSFGLSETLSLTYYSIFWTNPSFGSIGSGTDLWLEVGAGVSFPLLEDRLIINPSIGTTHGRLLSDAPKAQSFEGLVPSILGLYLDDQFEVEVFTAYYKALRNEGNGSGDYLLYWILPGVVLTKNISLGLHYEGFVNTRVSEGETNVFYQWLGAYFKFTVNDKYTFRFSAGKNTADFPTYSDQFYKLNVLIPLEN